MIHEIFRRFHVLKCRLLEFNFVDLRYYWREHQPVTAMRGVNRVNINWDYFDVNIC